MEVAVISTHLSDQCIFPRSLNKLSTDGSAFSIDTHRSPLPAAIATPAHTIYPTVQISPLCSLAHCAVGFQQGSGYRSYFRLLSASDLQSLSYAAIRHALRFTEDHRKQKCSKAALMSPVTSHSMTMARFEPLFQSRLPVKVKCPSCYSCYLKALSKDQRR